MQRPPKRPDTPIYHSGAEIKPYWDDENPFAEIILKPQLTRQVGQQKNGIPSVLMPPDAELPSPVQYFNQQELKKHILEKLLKEKDESGEIFIPGPPNPFPTLPKPSKPPQRFTFDDFDIQRSTGKFYKRKRNLSPLAQGDEKSEIITNLKSPTFFSEPEKSCIEFKTKGKLTKRFDGFKPHSVCFPLPDLMAYQTGLTDVVLYDLTTGNQIENSIKADAIAATDRGELLTATKNQVLIWNVQDKKISEPREFLSSSHMANDYPFDMQVLNDTLYISYYRNKCIQSFAFKNKKGLCWESDYFPELEFDSDNRLINLIKPDEKIRLQICENDPSLTNASGILKMSESSTFEVIKHEVLGCVPRHKILSSYFGVVSLGPELTLWDLKRKKSLDTLQFPGKIGSLLQGTDRRLIVIFNNGDIRIFSIAGNVAENQISLREDECYKLNIHQGRCVGALNPHTNDLVVVNCNSNNFVVIDLKQQQPKIEEPLAPRHR